MPSGGSAFPGGVPAPCRERRRDLRKITTFPLSWRGVISHSHCIMKLHIPLATLLFCATAIVTPLVMAAPPAKPAPKAPAKPAPKAPAKPAPKPQPQAPAKPAGQAEILKKYDLDRSKTFNVTEGRTIQDAYIANPQDPLLKKYDTDKNGKISDAEIMKIIPPPPAPAKPKAAPKKPNKPQKKK